MNTVPVDGSFQQNRLKTDGILPGESGRRRAGSALGDGSGIPDNGRSEVLRQPGCMPIGRSLVNGTEWRSGQTDVFCCAWAIRARRVVSCTRRSGSR